MRPIYPQTGYTEANVVALLKSRQLIFADCYTITPRYGAVLRLTTRGVTTRVKLFDGSGPVNFESPSNLQISGLKLNIGIGTEVDEQDMQLSYDQTTVAWGIPLPKALRLGRLDGAVIRRDRYFAQSSDSPWMGGTPLFQGKVSSIDSIGRSGATIKIKSDLTLFNTRIPKDLFQPNCVHTLYDPGCTLDKEDFKVSGTTGAGSTAQVINWAGALPKFSLGMIYIDTPEGVTLVRTIRKATSTQLFLSYPIEFVPPNGTAFDAYEGCDRTYARCGVFSNEEHYKGFPFIPVAETAL